MKPARKPILIEDDSRLQRLTILRQFMNVLHIRESDAAAALGCSPITIGRWFRPSIDDCALSQAQRICSAFGHFLEVSYTDDPLDEAAHRVVQNQAGSSEIIIRAPKPRPVIPQGWRPKKPAEDLGGEQRLAFIIAAINNRGISRKEFADKMNLSTITVDYMFRNDDVQISRIFQIAEVLGASVRFTIHPDIAKANRDRRWCMYDMHLLTPLIEDPDPKKGGIKASTASAVPGATAKQEKTDAKE